MNIKKIKITLIASALLLSLDAYAQVFTYEYEPEYGTIDPRRPIDTISPGHPTIGIDSIGTGGVGDGADVHGNMHDRATANNIYLDWKANSETADDPFKRVAEGYKMEKDFHKAQYVESTYNPSVESFVAETIEQKGAAIEDRKSFRDEQIAHIYELSKRDEGVDAESFAAEYELFKEQKDTRAATYYEEKHAKLAAVGIDAHANNQTQNNQTASRAHTATVNLLSMINSDMQAQKSLIRSAFLDNYHSITLSQMYGSDAARLATNFSGECPACNLPNPVPDPVITEPLAPSPDPAPIFMPPTDTCDKKNTGWWRHKEWQYYQCE